MNKEEISITWWKESNIGFGICNKTNKVAFIRTTVLDPIVINSTSIDKDDRCFDGKHCFNKECRYNENKNYLREFVENLDFTEEELSQVSLEKRMENTKKYLDGINDYINESVIND